MITKEVSEVIEELKGRVGIFEIPNKIILNDELIDVVAKEVADY